MNFLDMQTVFFTLVVMDIVCTLMILLLWHQNRKRFAGLAFLVWGFIFLIGNA
jgi:hypothetical protein